MALSVLLPAGPPPGFPRCLEQHATDTRPDLIVVNPTYTGSGGRQFAHAETVPKVAAHEDAMRRWPFDLGNPPAIVKTRVTARSASATAKAKRTAARELRSALLIPDIARTAQRRILVYDDICTTASQRDAVAECLLDDGRAGCRSCRGCRAESRRESQARPAQPDRAPARSGRVRAGAHPRRPRDHAPGCGAAAGSDLADAPAAVPVHLGDVLRREADLGRRAGTPGEVPYWQAAENQRL